MVEETFAQALRAFARRRPFKSFVVELVNGERIVIEHSESLAFNAGAAVYVSPRRSSPCLTMKASPMCGDLPADAAAH